MILLLKNGKEVRVVHILVKVSNIDLEISQSLGISVVILLVTPVILWRHTSHSSSSSSPTSPIHSLTSSHHLLLVKVSSRSTTHSLTTPTLVLLGCSMRRPVKFECSSCSLDLLSVEVGYRFLCYFVVWKFYKSITNWSSFLLILD